MPEFRCACPEHEPLVGGGLRQWGMNHLTWFIEGYPSARLTKEQATRAWTRALSAWSAVCDLTFSPVSTADAANLVLGVGRGPRSQFDGPGGVLAWFELPPSDRFTGQLHGLADGDDDWTEEFYFQCMMHESGHAIGMDHTNVPNSLMNPVYNQNIHSPQAHDIAEAVARYGKPATLPPVTPPVIPVPAGVFPKAVKVQLSDGSVWAGTLAKI